MEVQVITGDIIPRLECIIQYSLELLSFIHFERFTLLQKKIYVINL